VASKAEKVENALQQFGKFDILTEAALCAAVDREVRQSDRNNWIWLDLDSIASFK
jgi:hypothetical protein